MPQISNHELAQTFPQLMRQISRIGLKERVIKDLSDTFDFAEEFSHGLYRKCGTPLLDHLVRTSSILLQAGQPIELVKSGMVHAIYIAHRFERNKRNPPDSRLRSLVTQRIGENVESILWDYGQTMMRGGLRHLETSNFSKSRQREIKIIILANDTEDFMDGAAAFGTNPLVEVEETFEVLTCLAKSLEMDNFLGLIRESKNVYQQDFLNLIIKRPFTKGYDRGGDCFRRKTLSQRVLGRAKSMLSQISM